MLGENDVNESEEYEDDETNEIKRNILLCFSGSVATVKIPQLYNQLIQFSNVKLVSSGDAAIHFLQRSKSYNLDEWNKFVENYGLANIYTDKDEWRLWNKLSDPVLHIELRNWAHTLLICPASADIMAKISAGISDTLLLSIVRAWNFGDSCYICPAMNSLMWTHPVTHTTLDSLQEWGFEIIQPVEKRLACNEIGVGALANVENIVRTIRENNDINHFSHDKGNSEVPSPLGVNFD